MPICRMRLRLAARLSVGLLAFVQNAVAAPDLGVYGSLSRFRALTGQHSDFRHHFLGWGADGAHGRLFPKLFPTMGRHPLLAISAERRGSEVWSPRAIARGGGDRYLVKLNHAFASWGRPIYFRPLPEMNGWWNAYCAFNENGSRRNAAHSTRAFRNAFRRIYLIAHGGPNVNRRLRALGLPRLRARLDANPRPRLRVLWNPQGSGSPDKPGNSARAYWPGFRYVDIVANDLYQRNGRAGWADARALYRAHPGKLYAFGEWALWGEDDPGFIRHMARFVRAHPRTVLLGYFHGRRGGVFDLATKPRARAAYRRYIVPL